MLFIFGCRQTEGCHYQTCKLVRPFLSIPSGRQCTYTCIGYSHILGAAVTEDSPVANATYYTTTLVKERNKTTGVLAAILACILP
eukprot:jgi/Chrzof1/4820/Cz15g00170.t1